MKKNFTFLSLLLIVSMLTAQSPFANFKSQIPDKSHHVKHNTSVNNVNKDSKWASLQTQQTNRDLNYSTVTLPLDTTFIFSEENVYDLSEMFGGGGSILGVIFKFNLSSLKTISITEENYLFDIGLFYDNLNIYVTDGSMIEQICSPGDYFVVLADFNVNLIGQSIHLTITEDNVDATPITLPFDNDVVLNSTNTIPLYFGARARYFSFTTTETALYNYSITSEDGDAGILYNNNYTMEGVTPFAAGTHYFAVVDFFNVSETADFTAHLVLNKNEDAEITQINIPYVGTIEFTEDLPTMYGDPFAVYTFTTTEAMSLSFYSENNMPYLELYSSTMNFINDGSSFAVGNLPAGTYFLYAYSDGYPLPYTDVLHIETLINYWDLDYSQEIALNQQISGSNDNLTAVFLEGQSINAAPYSFTATAGSIYKITMDVYASQNEIMAGIFMFHQNLTHNLGQDFVFSGGNYGYSNTMSMEMMFFPEESENLKLAFFSFDPNVYYTFKIEEIQPYIETPNTGDFAFAEMTLPFISTINFDATQYNNVIVDYAPYLYKAYHLSVAEPINLKYILGYYSDDIYGYYDVYMVIFADEELTNSITALYPGTNYTLGAGDYYILLSDELFFYYNNVYMTPQIYIDYEISNLPEIISLQELLDDPNITVVDWNNDLDYSDVGYWTLNSSKMFNDYGDPKFAKVYKLTNMPIDTMVNIHIGGSIDAYLKIAVKNSDDTYSIILNRDDGWGSIGGVPAFGNSYDSYELFSSDPTTQMDYYIIATTLSAYYDGHNNTPRMTTIWKGEAPAGEPVYGEPQTPELEEIVSTQTVTTVLNLQAPISNNEINVALMALEVTATTANNETFAVVNNPFAWEINSTQTQATFENYSNPSYAFAANYSAATVTLNIASSTNDLLTTKLGLYPNPAVDNIFIDGLQVSSKISIIDLNGKIVDTRYVSSQQEAINVSNLAKGTYIVTIQNGRSIDVLKFVK